MFNLKFLRNLLIILFVSAVVLLITNVYLKNGLPGFSGSEVDIDERQISTRFRNILGEFGIDDKLIRENISVDKQTEHKISNFRVQVPKDLTIPEILLSIFQSFRKDSLVIKAIEKVKGGKTTLTLVSGTATSLQAEFDYSKTISRNRGYLAFIIYDADLFNPATIDVIESSSRLTFLLRPDTKIISQLNLIRNNGQQFAVLIDDDISEQKYKLKPDFSEHRVITVIKTLVTDYQRAVYFVIDDNSDFYNSQNYSILNRELSKRKIKLFSTSDFIRLIDDEKMKSDFADMIELMQAGSSRVFLLNQQTYLSLNTEINKYKKKGFRVISSSLILKELAQN